MPIRLSYRAKLRDKIAKEDRDITISELVEKTGVSRPSLYRYEKEGSNVFDLIEALCDYFQCEPGDLLVRTTKEDKNEL